MTYKLTTGMQNRMKRGGSRAAAEAQISGALPQPNAPTALATGDTTHYLRYPIEVIRDGAVAYWRMGDTGGPALDRSGNGHTATASGALTFGVAGALVANIPAEVDTAVTFAGGTLTVADAPPTLADFSVELWLRSVQASGFPASVFDRSLAGVFPYRLRLLAGGLMEASRSDGTATATITGPTVTNDAWHHIIFSKEGATLSLRVDDAAALTIPDTTTPAAHAGALVIGSPTLAVTLDEVALYPLALSTVIVTRHRNAAHGIQA